MTVRKIRANILLVRSNKRHHLTKGSTFSLQKLCTILWLSGENVDMDVSETQTPVTTIDVSELSPSAVALINKFVTLTKSEQDTFVALASKIFSNNIENN